MDTRILTGRNVYDLLPMDECMRLMAEVLETTARGDAVNPLRTVLRFPDGNGLLGMMPAYLGEPRSAGIKIVTVMPGNHGTQYDSHQGAVMLFDVDHGCPLALIDASSITAIRTAAVSGVATRLLARSDAATLAILGSGVQARTHLDAMRRVRDILKVTVWSRSADKTRAFADRESKRHGIDIEVTESAQRATADADIICTTTSSGEPVLAGEWIAPGTHINAVGACIASCRELDTVAVVRSRLYVDRLESAHNEAGDFLIPKKEGKIGDDHIVGEIGDMLLGKLQGRRSHDEITMFKSLGIGVEDLRVAFYLYKKATAQDVGVSVVLAGDGA